MSRKRTTVYLIASALLSMIIITPILKMFGVPSAYDLLTNIFGHNDLLVFGVMLLAVVLIVVSAYKIPGK